MPGAVQSCLDAGMRLVRVDDQTHLDYLQSHGEGKNMENILFDSGCQKLPSQDINELLKSNFSHFLSDINWVDLKNHDQAVNGGTTLCFGTGATCANVLPDMRHADGSPANISLVNV